MARAPKAHPNAALIAAAQAALPLARDADEKGAAPIIINAGTSSVTLRPTKARIEKHIKLLGKQARKSAILESHCTARCFPVFEPGMSTQEYVKQYERFNDTLRKGAYTYSDLNAEPATLYEGGALDFVPVHEVCEEEPAAELLPVAEVESAPEVAELAPVVECEPLPVPEVVEIEPEQIEPAEVAEVVAEVVEVEPEQPADLETLRRRVVETEAQGPVQRIASRLSSAVAYLFPGFNDRPMVYAFVGESANTVHRIICKGKSERMEWVRQWFASLDPVREGFRITIERGEGLTELCGKPVTVASFAAADAVLRDWSETAPSTGGYDKCDVEIAWPDGSHRLRYDLKHHTCEVPSLTRAMIDETAFHLGEFCPEHMSGIAYAKHVQRLSDGSRDYWRSMKAKLQTAGVWRDIARPVCVDLGRVLQNGNVQAADLIGVGVVFTGYRDVCNDEPRGIGAIVAVDRHCATVQLEDGRQLIATWRDFCESETKPAMYLIDWRKHGAPYLAQIGAAVVARDAAKSSAKEMQRQAFEAQCASLKAQYPNLEQPGEKRDSLKVAATNCRKLLHAAWPKVKFSVRIERFSMGNAMRVSWTDGPTESDVSAVVDRFEAGSFDGMTDCYNYRDTPWNKCFGSAKYVSMSRDVSKVPA